MEPKRLFEDPATSAEVRNDLVRVLDAPDGGYDVAKGLVRLLAVTAIAPAAASAATSAKAAWLAGVAKWGLKWGAKWGPLGGAVIATAGVSGHFILARSHHPGVVSNPPAFVQPSAPAEPIATSELASAPIAARPSVASASAPTGIVAGDTPPIVSGHVPSQPPVQDLSRRQAFGTTDSSATSADDSVAREVALLGRARAVLASDPAQALRLTQQGQREFPRGVLGEEREAIAVLALLGLGQRTEGAARGQSFLARYPHGPFSERVRLALGTSNDGPAR